MGVLPIEINDNVDNALSQADHHGIAGEIIVAKPQLTFGVGLQTGVDLVRSKREQETCQIGCEGVCRL